MTQTTQNISHEIMCDKITEYLAGLKYPQMSKNLLLQHQLINTLYDLIFEKQCISYAQYENIKNKFYRQYFDDLFLEFISIVVANLRLQMIQIINNSSLTSKQVIYNDELIHYNQCAINIRSLFENIMNSCNENKITYCMLYNKLNHDWIAMLSDSINKLNKKCTQLQEQVLDISNQLKHMKANTNINQVETIRINEVKLNNSNSLFEFQDTNNNNNLIHRFSKKF